jgi:hypothetical protein
MIPNLKKHNIHLLIILSVRNAKIKCHLVYKHLVVRKAKEMLIDAPKKDQNAVDVWR